MAGLLGNNVITQIGILVNDIEVSAAIKRSIGIRISNIGAFFF